MDPENITTFDLTKYRGIIGNVRSPYLILPSSNTIEEVQEVARKANWVCLGMRDQKQGIVIAGAGFRFRIIGIYVVSEVVWDRIPMLAKNGRKKSDSENR